MPAHLPSLSEPPSSPHTTHPKREAGRHLWKEQERQSQQNLDLEQPCRNGVPLLHSLLKNEDNDNDNVKTRVRDVTPFECAGSRREIDFHPTREEMHVANLAQLPDPAPVADITNQSGLSFSLHKDAPSKASTKQAKIYWPSPSWSIQRPLPQVLCTAHTHCTHSCTYFPLHLGVYPTGADLGQSKDCHPGETQPPLWHQAPCEHPTHWLRLQSPSFPLTKS